jgi:hypothetical protein
VKYTPKPVKKVEAVPLTPQNKNTSHLSGFGDSVADLSNHWDETFAESHAFEWLVRRPSGASLDPHLWSVDETEAWVDAIGLGEYAPSFREHGVDGATLFYVTESELAEELGLTKVGLRKRFILARLWLSHAYRRSTAVRAAAKAKMQAAEKKISAVGALSPRSAANVAVAVAVATPAAAKMLDPMITGGNAPEWQVAEFKGIRNVLGILVAILEILISLLKLHYLWHLASLFPLVLGGFMAVLSAAKC